MGLLFTGQCKASPSRGDARGAGAQLYLAGDLQRRGGAERLGDPLQGDGAKSQGGAEAVPKCFFGRCQTSCGSALVKLGVAVLWPLLTRSYQGLVASLLVGARMLPVVPGLTTSNKKLLGAPGIATSNKKLLGAPGIATRSKKLLVTKYLGEPTLVTEANLLDTALQAAHA